MLQFVLLHSARWPVSACCSRGAYRCYSSWWPYDGVVSCLRVYSPEELGELTDGLDEFDWRIERPALGNPWARATVLVGMPR